MSIFGFPDVEKLKAQHDIDGLMRALNFKKNKTILWFENWGDRVNYRVLEWQYPFRGLKNFLKVLGMAGSTADLRIRAEAAEALSEIGGEQVTKALTEALNDNYNDDRVKSAITKALEKTQK